MRDPVTNVEIEDVLSSIRRLVSDDARIRPIAWEDAEAKDADAQDGQGESGAQADDAPDLGRLVLTPALRVSDADAGSVLWSDNVDLEVVEQPSDVTSVYVLDAHRDAAVDGNAHHADILPEAEPQAEAEIEPQAEAVVFASTRDGGGRGAALDPVESELAQDDGLDNRGFLLAEDETVLDEETLRELVAEIVRQELQGALGERITRNVRKLVRREIQRALTSNELE
jgi:cell pole-organizing protein PopZ